MLSACTNSSPHISKLCKAHLHLFQPSLAGAGGGLVCEMVGKADLLLDQFDSKQCRDSVDLPYTCHPSLQSYYLCIKNKQEPVGHDTCKLLMQEKAKQHKYEMYT